MKASKFFPVSDVAQDDQEWATRHGTSKGIHPRLVVVLTRKQSGLVRRKSSPKRPSSRSKSLFQRRRTEGLRLARAKTMTLSDSSRSKTATTKKTVTPLEEKERTTTCTPRGLPCSTTQTSGRLLPTMICSLAMTMTMMRKKRWRTRLMMTDRKGQSFYCQGFAIALTKVGISSSEYESAPESGPEEEGDAQPSQFRIPILDSEAVGSTEDADESMFAEEAGSDEGDEDGLKNMKEGILTDLRAVEKRMRSTARILSNWKELGADSTKSVLFSSIQTTRLTAYQISGRAEAAAGRRHLPVPWLHRVPRRKARRHLQRERGARILHRLRHAATAHDQGQHAQSSTERPRTGAHQPRRQP